VFSFLTGFAKVCSGEVNRLLAYFTVEITSTIMQIIKITDTNSQQKIPKSNGIT